MSPQEWRDSIFAKNQLRSEEEINDFIALTGMKLALAAGLPLQLKTMVLLGVCALNALPATPEQAVLDRIAPQQPQTKEVPSCPIIKS